jgi:abortive infection bacteriophage resistance protein
MRFNKPPLSIPDQLAKLKGRGLQVPDDPEGRRLLRVIGYYRFSAYTLPFQQCLQPDKPFRPGISIEDIEALYVFDRELRLLVMDALERIEIGLRSAIVNRMCLQYGAHWFMEPVHFSGGFNHAKLIAGIEEALELLPGGLRPMRKHSEVFINHYYSKYGDPRLPPAWMVAETMSLGTLSRVFAALQRVDDRNAIAAAFGYDEAILRPWLHTLNYVRNLCAHHARLWNRQLVIKAQTPKKHSNRVNISDRLHAVAVVMTDLLRALETQTGWGARFIRLVESCPKADRKAMGLPSDWDKDPFWQPPGIDPACFI